MKKLLTLKKLKSMKPETIIASGVGLITHPWFNNAKKFLEKDGRSVKVKWVAVRGFYHDWAIYHSMDANFCPHLYFDCDCHLRATIDQILKFGAKLHDRERIRNLVPCDDEALAMYRD